MTIFVDLRVRLNGKERVNVSIVEGNETRPAHPSEICPLEAKILKLGSKSVKILDREFVRVLDESYGCKKDKNQCRYLRYRVV